MPDLTDTDARRLLALAADTIEVSPVATVTPLPRRPRWTPFVAAAAVLALVAGSTWWLGRPDSPDPAPATSAVPSVFGYDAATAQRVLEDAGFEVDTTPDPICSEVPGRAVGTTPPPGTRTEGPISLRVTAVPSSGRCSTGWRSEAWQLVDFAQGLGPGPDWAPTVTLRVDEEPSVVLTRDDVADPDRWPTCAAAELVECPANALDAIVQRLADARAAADLDWTLYTRDPRTPGVLSFDLTMEPNNIGAPAPPWAITVGIGNGVTGPEGKVVAVTLDTDPSPRGSTVPSVFGYDATTAQGVLESTGLQVEVSFEDTCRQTPGRAIATSPEAGRPLPTDHDVTLVVSRVPPRTWCLPSPDRALAWQLIDVAQGHLEQGPDWAPTVSLGVDALTVVRVPRDDLADRGRWPTCSAAERVTCPANALDLLLDALTRARTDAEAPWALRTEQEVRFGGSSAFRMWLTPEAGDALPPWHITVTVGDELSGHPGKVVGVHLETDPVPDPNK